MQVADAFSNVYVSPDVPVMLSNFAAEKLFNRAVSLSWSILVKFL